MNVLEEFRQIKTVILDVDGVLTNSDLIIQEDGSLLRKMHTRDGYAIKAALKAGLQVCIITGGKSAGVIKRLKALGITDVYSGIQDKKEAYDELVYTYSLDPERILYMGDDLPDYEVMRYVGMPCCPADAAPEILQLSRYISPIEGGKGCVRDVLEKILKLKQQWMQ